MTSKKTTRRVLFSSVISLILCCAMLIGTTFAWFTDTVTSGRNIIQSGNLDVEMYYKTKLEDEWTKVDSTTKLFSDEALWEPGYTQVVYFKVVNEGSLALKYKLAANVYSETLGKTKDDADIRLSDHLKAGYMAVAAGFGMTAEDMLGITVNNTFANSREKFATFAAGEMTNFEQYGGMNLNQFGAVSETVLLPDEDNVGFMVITMPTTVGNEANHNGVGIPKIELGITLLATQHTHEEDSFGNDYDKDADYEDPNAMNIIPAPADAVAVSTFEELKAAVANGGNIKLANGIAVNETLDITGDVAIYGEGNSLVQAAGYTGTIANVSGSLSLYSVSVDGQVDWAKINTPSVQNPTVTSTTAADYYIVNSGVASTENVFAVTGTLSLVSSEIKNFIAPNMISVSAGTVNLDDTIVEKNIGRIIATGSGATVNVNDGTAIQNNLAVKIDGGLVRIAASTININKGASFNNNLGIQSDLFYSPNASSGTLNINGGKLDGNEVYSTNNSYGLIYMDTTLKVIVDNGGEITNNVGGAEAVVSTRRNRDRMELNSGKITGNVSTTGGYILSIRATQIGADMVIDGKVYVRLGSTDAEHYFTNAGVINGDVTVSQLNTLFVNTGTINGNLAMIDGSLGCDNQGTITGTVTP